MKYKRSILILSFFIMAFVYLLHPLLANKVKNTYKDNLIRFHIRANSDRQEDQVLKEKIRDEILEEMKEEFAKVQSIDKGREIILKNMDRMKAIAEEVIKKEEENYMVKISLGQDNFPTRKYGSIVLPTGEYETLLITLGEGRGQNWWCIMFPPLCFVDISHSLAYNLEKDLEAEPVREEEPVLKLRWKIVDVLKKINLLSDLNNQEGDLFFMYKISIFTKDKEKNYLKK